MRTNFATKTRVFTHEGAPSTKVSPIQQLRRLSMACLLWEDTFYVDGKKHTEILEEVCQKVKGEKIVGVALEAHQKGLLRHLPLYLIVQALKKGAKCAEAIEQICNRPDQMTELLSLYWKNGKVPLAAQLKKGLAKAFTKFDEYQLSKYNRDNPIKLRDVLFLCHAKPNNEAQEILWKKLISKTLSTPETWETKLSSGQDKKESFAELLEKGKMGKLAIVRNLRNMLESGVPSDLVERELMKKGRPILPFQFLAAAANCKPWEPIIDRAMIASLQNHEKMDGITVVFVDVSGSMNDKLSEKSTITRMDAASAICILLREICEKVDIFTFSNSFADIPPRQGMALRDAIFNSQPHLGTYLGKALIAFNSIRSKDIQIKRIIIITDEQTHDTPSLVTIPNGYIIKVATNQNGIQNKNNWLTINGFSEHVIDYIREVEKDCNSET